MYRSTVFIVLITLSGLGCSAGLKGSTALLQAGDAGKAAEAARARLETHPEDAVAMRDLGIALYQSGHPSDALTPLEHALKRRPRDVEALLFRARARDALQRVPEALAAYGEYLRLVRGSSATPIRARVEQLRREQIHLEVKRSIAMEDSLAAGVPSDSTIAVPDFANPAQSDTLRPVAKGLAAMMVTDLAQVPQLRVLERQRISTLVNELNLTHAGTAGPVRAKPLVAPEPIETVLGQQQRLSQLIDPATGNPFYSGPLDGVGGPGLVDAVRAFQKAQGLNADGIIGRRSIATLDAAWRSLTETAEPQTGTPPVSPIFDPRSVPRMGRLLGAQTIVQGSVLPLGADRLELRADILRVTHRDQGARPSAPIEGNLSEILDLEKRLVFNLLDSLGIRLDREERRRIERKPTENLEAFFAYCRGMDYEDRGMVQEALSQYQQAFARDPGFDWAAQASAVLSVGPADLQRVDRASVEKLAGADEADAARRAAATADKLGVAPEMEEEPGIDTRTPETLRGEGAGHIIVIGDLPGAGGRGGK